MAIFHRVQIEKPENLEEISSLSQDKITKKIEEEIRHNHSHTDGSPVALSAVESSEIEHVLNDDEINFTKTALDDMPKYKNRESNFEPSDGKYVSETKSHPSPVFVCTCGVGFSASANKNGIDIYRIEDYRNNNESGGYSSKAEPISESYAQPIKY